MGALPVVEIIYAFSVLFFIRLLFVRKRLPAPLPPGPKGKFLVGNLDDLPPPGEQEWVHWSKHKELYGRISSLTTFGQTLILLNDLRVATELLEKRSLLHSSRPKMPFCGEMVGWENPLGVLQYTDRLREYRKNIHNVIGTKSAVTQFHELLEIEVRRFLLRVLKEPQSLVQHVRTETGAIILKISHGYTIEPNGSDPLVDLADRAMLQFSLSATPGTWMVDMLPFLKHIPSWIPGTTFKKTAVRWRETLMEVVEKPYAFVKHQMRAGTHSHSYTSTLLETADLTPEEEFVVKWSAMSLYSGGADTTVALLSIFFLAMTLYPEVQRKAQEEIDRIIGNHRLPGFEDREQLPYIDAIVKEVLRWHTIGPIGIPHASTEDDICEGYYIPKDAILIANIWGFTHDPDTYHDPMVFKPERFLGVDGRAPEMDPHALSFGFGRRVCPGRELADASAYLTVAQSLAVFNIDKAVENGKVVGPSVSFTSGIISHPAPFKTDIRPRSKGAEALIRSIEEDHPFTESDAKVLLDLKF